MRKQGLIDNWVYIYHVRLIFIMNSIRTERD